MMMLIGQMDLQSELCLVLTGVPTRGPRTRHEASATTHRSSGVASRPCVRVRVYARVCWCRELLIHAYIHT